MAETVKIETAERIDFMRKIHLFHQLEDDQLTAVAEKLQEVTYKTDDVIVQQGTSADRFFMIYSGSVKVSRQKRRGGQVLATLVQGDYFGEESLLSASHHRTATVSAKEPTTLLALSRHDFNHLLKKAKQLRPNFLVAVNSRRLSRRMNFKWLRDKDGEVIYYLARKHPILLVRALIAPAFVGLFALIGVASGLSLNLPILMWASAAILGLALGWGLWNGVDWRNDYYIVTNQRVVWLEKVVGLYDSRQEAPLSSVQRINVQTEFWGRQLDYGHLIVRTIVGSTINLANVDHPNQAAALIEEQWKRAKSTSRKMEEDAMRQALRERILHKGAPRPPGSLVQKPAPTKKDPYAQQHGLANLFRFRFEGDTITYRKHPFVLIQKIWLPTIFLFALVGWMAYELFHISKESVPALLKNLGVDVLLILWVFLLIGIFLWWLYRYVDWANDIFQVTNDQIMDIDKTPFGQVTSDIASLDNILHLEYRRKGILQLLFNYGDVDITIGGGKGMTFEDVVNPSAVQDDIERRRLERITKKEQDAIKAERERMADWFAAYHHSTEELNGGENQEKKTGGSEVK